MIVLSEQNIKDLNLLKEAQERIQKLEGKIFRLEENKRSWYNSGHDAGFEAGMNYAVRVCANQIDGDSPDWDTALTIAMGAIQADATTHRRVYRGKGKTENVKGEEEVLPTVCR